MTRKYERKKGGEGEEEERERERERKRTTVIEFGFRFRAHTFVNAPSGGVGEAGNKKKERKCGCSILLRHVYRATGARFSHAKCNLLDRRIIHILCFEGREGEKKFPFKISYLLSLSLSLFLSFFPSLFWLFELTIRLNFLFFFDNIAVLFPR